MDIPIVTRVPQYIKDWLAERAVQEGRSLSKEVQRILQQAHAQRCDMVKNTQKETPA